MRPIPALCMMLGAALGGAAKAETLADAIALAYQTNPTLISQRAQLQATDETYVQAEAGFRPTVSAQGVMSYAKSPQANPFGGGLQDVESNTGTGSIGINQPIYSGGRTTAQVRVAQAQIRAGREQLRGVEATVLYDVIQAYLDVIRDRASLVIQRESLKTLEDATNEIRARYQSGANTVTDARQAEAQLEAGRALVYSAQAQLEISNAEYVATVGQSPGELAPPPPLPNLPVNLDQAFDISEDESPTIRQARYAETASRGQVQEARAALRPTVSLAGSIGATGTIVPLDHRTYEKAAQATVTFNQPLFTGGLTSSQIRQAVSQNTSARVQIDVARRTAIQTVSQAWSQRNAAHLNTTVDAAEVSAAQATFDGMRVEYRAGLRQTLDVLIAQETLRDAQIALAGARHDEYVADALVLNAVGRLEARIILQGAPLYQPQVSFRRNERKDAVPWEIVPKLFDRVGEPTPPQPGPLPVSPNPSGAVHMTVVSAPPTNAPLETVR